MRNVLLGVLLLALAGGLMVRSVSAQATPEASPQLTFDGPFAEDFAKAYANATSDFERGVLADGRITEAEYRMAVDRYVTCLEKESVVVQLTTQPETPMLFSYLFEPPDGMSANELRVIADSCAHGTTYQIEALYNGLMLFPNNEDPEPWIYVCLIKEGEMPAWTPYDDFLWTMNEMFGIPQAEDAIAPADGPAFETNDPQIMSCFVNPLRIGL